MCCTSSQNIKLVGVGKLNKLFLKNKNFIHYNYRAQCQHCGCRIDVIVTKTPGGYGMKGGAICQNSLQGIYGICTDCYKELVNPF